jgi:Protein of unknown function (DUF1566)
MTGLERELKIGDRTADGTIYAGISPNTYQPMYVTPEDAPETYTFKEATRYAKKLDAHGHKDWRIPSERELTVLFNNRGAIGAFNSSGLYSGLYKNAPGWYWSSSQNINKTVHMRIFSNGARYQWYPPDFKASLRCVRG